jgi:glycosyltransferase involved in cell wall biosynthesis
MSPQTHVPVSILDRPPTRVAIISEPGMAGVKTHVVDILRNIDLRGVQIEYYYSLRRSDAAFLQDLKAIEARGIRCIEVPMAVELRASDDLRALMQLWKHLRRFRPQVLHLHSSKASGLGRLLSLFLRPKPVVVYTPNAMACYRSKFYLLLERTLGHLTDVLVAVSASEKKDFIEWKIPGAEEAAQLTVGVRDVPVRASIADPNTWTIGACGRICYQKNALLFFRTALAMIPEDPSLRFRWIGEFADDEEAREVRALLAAAGNPKEITITGWVADPHQEMAALNTFCMFSRYESFGYVTADAMLLGVPVTALPSTGTVDLVQDGITGLITRNDPSHVAADLRRIKTDAGLRKRLIAQAREFVAQVHTIDAMVSQMEQMYRTAAGQPVCRGAEVMDSAAAMNGAKLEDSYRGGD